MVATAEVVDRKHFRDLLGTTPNGKEIYLVRKPNTPLRTIAFGSGGQLPECLSGGFSSIKMAQGAAIEYINSLALKPKGRSTAKK